MTWLCLTPSWPGASADTRCDIPNVAQPSTPATRYRVRNFTIYLLLMDFAFRDQFPAVAQPRAARQHFPYRWNDLIRWSERNIKWPLANRWERCNRRESFSRNDWNARYRILNL